MTPADTDRLTKLVRDAKQIYVQGTVPKYITGNFKHKLVSAIVPTCDLIVINHTNHDHVITLLKNMSHSCDILICSMEDGDFSGPLYNFLDQNCSKFQYSRQMKINGKREQSVLIKFNASSTRLPERTDTSTIILVLKTGGIYDSRYVNATAQNIRSNITRNHEIICLTDNPSGINAVDRIVKFNHDWPKWWGKIEAFRSDITTNKHCIFIDLDTVCFNNIDFLHDLSDGFYGLRDFYSLQTFQTGILKWDVSDDTINIYESFKNVDLSKYMDKGDHQWTGVVAKNKKFLQDECPGKIFSYKKHLAHVYRKFVDPSILCFHGDPRPHTVKDTFITDVWKY